MKIKFTIYSVLLTGILMILLLNCKKEAVKAPPTVIITMVTNVASTSANSGGEVTSDGGTTVTERGLCWSVSQNPTILDNKIANGTGLGSFKSSLTGLIPGTTYNLKAYATNSVGTSYSSQAPLTTLALAPLLTTAELTAITSSSANGGGNITNNGGAEVTARGICWSTTQNPTITDSKTTDGTGSGSFTSSITGLTPGVTYYFRGYATNSIGTAYGNQVTAITTAILPIITTIPLSSFTSSTATSGGNITNDGGAVITARGVCWSTSQIPTIVNTKTADGIGSGSFTSTITGLSPGTTYYIRAFATNSIGTTYGNEITTTTTANIPTITTTSLSSMMGSTASSGGNISSNGGAAVTARGICWSTNANPMIINNKTTDGIGTGIFTSAITGLLPGVTYFFRAYATNSVGTGYGNQVSFTTTIQIPTLTTIIVSSITNNSATSGGNISNDGGGIITTRGVCWSTTIYPTTENDKTSDNIGSGSFTSTISGLTAGTTYYLRAYATNNAGTTYGSQVSFVTQHAFSGPVIDADGNTYSTITIGTQVWMTENLKTTKYNDGTAILLVPQNYADYNSTTPGYCWYKNDAPTNKSTYGALYNWFAVNTGKLCPTGWHVPTNAEWATLINYLGGEGVAGGKLKETGITHWNSPNTGATNSSGFSALPGGERFYDNNFFYIQDRGFWWSSTNNNFINSGFMYIISGESGVHNNYIWEDVRMSFSVRCLKD